MFLLLAAFRLGATALLVGGTLLGLARLLRRLGFYVGQVLRRALPGRVEDQALVVLGLRQDARPGVEERGRGRHGVGDGLRGVVS